MANWMDLVLEHLAKEKEATKDKLVEQLALVADCDKGLARSALENQGWDPDEAMFDIKVGLAARLYVNKPTYLH